jgi:hypothetical protein
LRSAQENQQQADQHRIVLHDPDEITVKRTWCLNSRDLEADSITAKVKGTVVHIVLLPCTKNSSSSNWILWSTMLSIVGSKRDIDEGNSARVGQGCWDKRNICTLIRWITR